MAETKISKGIVIDGEIQAQEPVTIEGSVKGQIVTSALVTVATGAVVEANVNTTQIQIHGAHRQHRRQGARRDLPQRQDDRRCPRSPHPHR